MDTVVNLMLRYFAAIDSGDDAAIEAEYQAWMTARGEKPAKRLVAIGDAGGVTAVAPEWKQRRSDFKDWVWDETDPEGLRDHTTAVAAEIASKPHIYADVPANVAQAVARHSVRICYKCNADLGNKPAYQSGSGWYCTSH